LQLPCATAVRGRGQDTINGEPYHQGNDIGFRACSAAAAQEPGRLSVADPDDACIREIKEETGLQISIRKELTIVSHAYTHFKVQLRVFLCTYISGDVVLTNVQFADMLAGIVQGHFEDGNSTPWTILRNNISYQTLFFYPLIDRSTGYSCNQYI